MTLPNAQFFRKHQNGSFYPIFFYSFSKLTLSSPRKVLILSNRVTLAFRNMMFPGTTSVITVPELGELLRVNDNGCGIDPVISAEGKAGHFGLQGMRERAKRIGSKLMLNSSPNSGTAITLVVPGNIVFRNGSATRFEKIKSFFGLERVSLEKL